MDNSDLRQILDKFLTFGVFEQGVEIVSGKEIRGPKIWKIYEYPFKSMIGMLGKFFIGDRMFQTIRMLEGKPKANYISLRAYLKYTDIIYNGTLEEKDKISFLMIDIAGTKRVTFADYKQFWGQFLDMYGQILQTKISYDENTAQLTEQTFKMISKKKEEDLTDTDFFNVDDFLKARNEARTSPDTADFFAWLDTPQEYVENFLKQQTEKEIKVELKQLTDYHDRVVGAFEEIAEKLQQSFGIDLEEDDEWLFIQKLKEDVARRSTVVLKNTMLVNVEEKIRRTIRKSCKEMIVPLPIKVSSPIKQQNRREAMKSSNLNPLEQVSENRAEEEADELSEIREDHNFKNIQKGVPHSMSIKTMNNRATGNFDIQMSGSARNYQTFGNEDNQPDERVDPSHFEFELSRNDAKLVQEVEKSKMAEVFNLIKGKLGEIIGQYQAIIQKIKVKTDLSRATKTKPIRRMANNDELKGGKFVKFDSQNFDIIVNILIGIRKSLSNLTNIPGRELDEHEYHKRLSSQNDWVQQNNNERQNVAEFKFYDYAPLVFHRIRQLSGISEEQYRKSLGAESILSCFFNNNFETLYELCSSGQSGSLFYYTSDSSFMMKTIPEREFDKLRTILKPYFKFLQKYPDSLICRFYGLHRVLWMDSHGIAQIRYLVIMGNLFQNLKVDLIYDLKGSTQGRTRLKEGQKPQDFKDKKIALKDNDFLQHLKSITFVETKSDEFALARRKMIDIIKTDTKFLQDCEIIDYSLLLGQVENDRQQLRESIRQDPANGKGIYFTSTGLPFVVGIIDPLTGWRQVLLNNEQFSTAKQFEWAAKSLRYGNTMSCVPPLAYAERFYRFCQTNFQSISYERLQQQTISPRRKPDKEQQVKQGIMKTKIEHQLIDTIVNTQNDKTNINEKRNIQKNLDQNLSQSLGLDRNQKYVEPQKIEARAETEPQRLARSAVEAQERIQLKRAEKALADEKSRKEKETNELNAKQLQRQNQDDQEDSVAKRKLTEMTAMAEANRLAKLEREKLKREDDEREKFEAIERKQKEIGRLKIIQEQKEVKEEAQRKFSQV